MLAVYDPFGTGFAESLGPFGTGLAESSARAVRGNVGREGEAMAATIAIIGALEKEVRGICDALEDAFDEETAGIRIAGGRYAGHDVVATTAGMGTVNVAAATQLLISAYDANTVIFSGIAGGLNPALHIDDIVIGEHLRYTDTDTALIAESAPGLEEFASTPSLVDLAEQVLRDRGYHDIGGTPGCDSPGYLRGTIATGNRFVTGADMRAAVVEATQADCAEMEGAAVAHVAAKNGIACLVLRAISDNCDEAYDAFCERDFDLDGYARRASEIALEIVSRLD